MKKKSSQKKIKEKESDLIYLCMKRGYCLVGDYESVCQVCGRTQYEVKQFQEKLKGLTLKQTRSQVKSLGLKQKKNKKKKTL